MGSLIKRRGSGPGLWIPGLLLAWLLASGAAAQIDPADLLPADEAFAVSARADNGAVVIQWDIAPGYYMYRHQFAFEARDARLGEAELPAGQQTEDEFFGHTEIYRERVSVRLPVTRHVGGPLSLTLRSQGCADLGVCYPPHRQQVSVDLPAVPAAGAGSLTQALSGLGNGITFTTDDAPLPAEQAFVYEAIALDAGTLLVRFIAHEGYYLYRDQFDFSIGGEAADEVVVAQAVLPPAEPIHDEYFGDTRVYFGEVEIPVHLSRPAGEARRIELRAAFQGCQTDGICYPPMTRSASVDLPAAGAAIRAEIEADTPAGVPPVSEQDRLAGALGGAPLLAMGLFFIAGILLAFTPCVFPMVPILSGLIAGEGERITTAGAFRLSLVYVLAMALVYTAFGVVAGLFGQNLQALFQHPLILGAFAGLFVLLSLAMFGFYELQLPASVQTRLSQWSNRQSGGSLIGAAIMGALSALIVGPCVAPALMGALIYIGQTGDAVLGGGALFAMALGMGVPLMVWGTSAGKLLPRAGAWMNAVKAVFGVGLLALAIWMLERVVPPVAVMLMWGALAIACGVYLGALTRLPDGVPGWRKLWQSLGVVLLVLGILQLVGAASGARDWTRPLAGLTAAGPGAAAPEVRFDAVNSVAELEDRLARADRPVFLDFYADWCVDCRRMQRRTFPDPAVAERLSGFIALKADVTDYTADHQALLQHFGLIGPPAYLFFIDGEEIAPARLIGFSPPDRFATHLDQVARP